jgi:hypothetical protein
VQRLIRHTDAHGTAGARHRRETYQEELLFRELCKKLGEYADSWNRAVLYHIQDITDALIDSVDPAGAARQAHAEKVAEMGGFEQLIEWTPVPAAA